MKKWWICLCSLALGCCLNAQTLKEARELFLAEDYVQSMPVFEQELKAHPKDAALNYWYGSCLYHTGDKAAAIPYLLKGEKGKIKEASFLLAAALFSTSQYDACLEHLDTYIMYQTGMHGAETASMIKSCEKIKQMLNSVEDVVFIDSLIVHKKELLANLPLHAACGSLFDAVNIGSHVKDSCLRYAYGNEKGDRIYAADSVGEQGYDLLRYDKMLDKWGKQALDGNINQASNEVNPYLMSDGVTIYFASDGHNSIGGYDLFVSSYNPVTDQYFNPEALPLPFNSTANDYLYIVDEQIGRGFLVSDRRQAPDSLIIYTFLPNEFRTIVKGQDAASLLSLAEIRSIADTWKGLNVDSIKAIQDRMYHESLSQMPLQTEVLMQEDPQSVFIVRDDLTYLSEQDFRSPQAKALYQEYLVRKAERDGLLKRLEQAREHYQALTDLQQKQQSARQMAEMEERLPSLDESLKLKEYRIRALELDYLSQHKP